ncbi:MAG: hypothetical protein KH230_09545 [Enterocloster asparagiformis]|nr:hypothetical protein [Enterocloster asparagiformis]
MEPVWIERIANLYSSLLSVGLITCLFGLKRPGLKGGGEALAATAAYYCVLDFLNRNYQFEGVAAILYGLVLFTYGCLALNGSAEYKAVFCVIWNCVLLLSSLGSFVLLYIFTGLSIHDLWHPLGSSRITALLCGSLLKGLIALAMAAGKGFGRMNLPRGSGWKRTLGLLGYFLLSIEAFLLMMGVMIRGEGAALLPVFYIVLAGLFFTLLYAFYQNLMWRRESREARYLRESMAQQAEYIRSYAQLCQELRLLRHDARGHMVTMHILLKEGKQEQAAAYLEKMAQQRSACGKMGPEENCGRDDGAE